MSGSGTTPSTSEAGITPIVGLPLDCVLFEDDREPLSVTDKLEADYEGITDHLDYGDYWICTTASGLVGIERKTPSDLLSSLSEGRLDSQLAGLAANVDVPILLVHGLLRCSPRGYILVGGDVETGWTYDSVLNKIQTYQEMGVRLQHCPSGDAALIRRLISLARYFNKPHHQLAPRIHGLQVFSRETQPSLLALSQFPGVGVDRARSLLKHFVTLQAVANASVKELRFVDGIGPKVAKQVFATFR